MYKEIPIAVPNNHARAQVGMIRPDQGEVSKKFIYVIYTTQNYAGYFRTLHFSW